MGEHTQPQGVVITRDALIVRLHGQGYSQRGIAREIGISQPAVRKRLIRLGCIAPSPCDYLPRHLRPEVREKSGAPAVVSDNLVKPSIPAQCSLVSAPAENLANISMPCDSWPFPADNPKVTDEAAQQKALTLLRFIGAELQEQDSHSWGSLVLFAVDVLEGKRAWGGDNHS